jgi:hypothetical protein
VKVEHANSSVADVTAPTSEAPTMKAETQKGTIFASVNFDDDDNVFDEEAEKERVAHLNESTINAIIGGRVYPNTLKPVSPLVSNVFVVNFYC